MPDRANDRSTDPIVRDEQEEAGDSGTYLECLVYQLMAGILIPLLYGRLVKAGSAKLIINDDQATSVK